MRVKYTDINTDLYSQQVVCGAAATRNGVSDIELAGQAGVFREPDIHSVQPEVGTAVHALEHHEHSVRLSLNLSIFLPLPLLR